MSGDNEQRGSGSLSTTLLLMPYESIHCPLCDKFMGEWRAVGVASFLKKCPRCGKMVEIKKEGA